jgi:hypothetical protein
LNCSKNRTAIFGAPTDQEAPGGTGEANAGRDSPHAHFRFFESLNLLLTQISLDEKSAQAHHNASEFAQTGLPRRGSARNDGELFDFVNQDCDGRASARPTRDLCPKRMARRLRREIITWMQQDAAGMQQMVIFR